MRISIRDYNTNEENILDYGGHVDKKKEVICNFVPGNQVTVYNSR